MMQNLSVSFVQVIVGIVLWALLVGLWAYLWVPPSPVF